MVDITVLKKIEKLMEKSDLMEKGDHECGFFLKSKVAWPSSLPSTKALRVYFEQYGPQARTFVELGGSVVDFISLEELTGNQMGYRSIEDGVPVPEWNQEHVLIALYNGDAIMVNTGNVQTEVLAAYANWNPAVIASSLGEFFEAVYAVMDIVYNKFNFEVLNEETCEPLEDYMREVEVALKSILSESHRINFILFNHRKNE